MGLVCKNNNCQILNATQNLPVDAPPPVQQHTGSIGGVCDSNADVKCVNGALRIQQGEVNYCLPSENSGGSGSARFFVASATLKRLFHTSVEEVAIIQALKMESSVLNPVDYSSRAQGVIESMSKDWGIGLKHNEICEHEAARCSFGLVCKVAKDNRRCCYSPGT